MKILHVTASYKPAFVYGGPIMSVAKLCEEVSRWTEDRGLRTKKQKSDVELMVYTTLANGKEELPYLAGEERVVDGVLVKYFKRLTKDHSHFSPALYLHLWKTVKQFDIVHIHAWWNLVTMPACLITLLRGGKVLLTPRGTLSEYSFINNNSRLKNIFHQWIGQFLLNKCYFHCTSEKEVADTKKLLQPKAIFDIPNFVVFPNSLNMIRQSNLTIKQGLKNNCEDHLKLIFLSRIEQKKGLELLFDALVTLDFNWSLAIVGAGEEEYVKALKAKVESLKLNESIYWVDAIYGLEKFTLLTQHDFLILPSFDENFANVVIESLATGTPVILTENVGLSAYVKKNGLGIVHQRDLNSLIKALNMAKEAKHIGTFSPEVITKRVMIDFQELNIRNQYVNCYRKILSID